MNGPEVRTLAKLQVFIDHAFGIPPHSGEGEEDGGFAGGLLDGNPKRLTVGFLRMAIEDTPEYRCIAAGLRRTEIYSMVSFLLQQGQGENLAALSERYGISAGHFRRIFRASLGDSPKATLKGWRLASAVLDVIERRQSVTDVAMAHGYASPSHFSSEVKKLTGLSLTRLFDVRIKK